MDTTALADNQAIDVAAWVSGQPGFTTTEAPLILAIVRAVFGRLRAVAGEPAGYADGSRFHELREGRLNMALWSDRSAYADTPLYTQPATPASGESNFDAIEDVLRRLDGWGKAYPVDMFHEPTKEERDWLHATRPGLMDCIAASMGRHVAACIAKDLAELRELTTPPASKGGE